MNILDIYNRLSSVRKGLYVFSIDNSIYEYRILNDIVSVNIYRYDYIENNIIECTNCCRSLATTFEEFEKFFKKERFKKSYSHYFKILINDILDNQLVVINKEDLPKWFINEYFLHILSI